MYELRLGRFGLGPRLGVSLKVRLANPSGRRSWRSSPLPLDYAIALVHLYAEKGDPKFEPAALRYLERYISEESPSLTDVAGTAALLAERAPNL